MKTTINWSKPEDLTIEFAMELDMHAERVYVYTKENEIAECFICILDTDGVKTAYFKDVYSELSIWDRYDILAWCPISDAIWTEE